MTKRSLSKVDPAGDPRPGPDVGSWRRRVRAARERRASTLGIGEARRRELAALAEAVQEGRARVLAERARTLGALAAERPAPPHPRDPRRSSRRS